MPFLKSTTRFKFLKVFLVITGIVIFIILGLHLWFTNNARNVLKQYIAEESKGKIQLSLSGLNLNLFTKTLQLKNTVLISTDSIHSPITYKVSFSSLSLKLASLWPLLFNKKLLLDSVKLYDPVIAVYQWRKDTSRNVSADELSIPQELGKVYTSMLDALDEFAIRRIVIDNAAISLVDKIHHTTPSTVSGIFFDLARTPRGKGQKRTFDKEKQTIELKIGKQEVALPGGRHHIAFSSLNLQLLRQAIILDSCTLTAIATDSVKTNYTIFFKKLQLTGVDFAAMSNNNVIRADTVFCDNPVFNFNLYQADAKKKKSGLPDPDNIIKELSGNLDLAYVEVRNAGINFEVYGKNRQSFFNSNKDNFLIRAFRINPDSVKPVSIGSFDMTLRDYQLYNADSSSAFSFDSLQFFDNRVVLNNFSMISRPGMKLQNSVNVSVPYFELNRLNWYRLIFDQVMVAKEAVLLNPVINYTRRKPASAGKKLDLFDALLNLDSMVSLENVTIRNGLVNMKLGASTSFNVHHINLKIQTNQLLLSTNKEGLRSAVERLSFSKGILKTKDLTAALSNVRFTGKNLVYADRVVVSGIKNRINATINDVYLDNVQLDDDAEEITVDGLRWRSAAVSIRSLVQGKGKTNNSQSKIVINHIQGSNTRLHITGENSEISTFIHSLTAASLIKRENDPVRVEGFAMNGQNFLFTNNELALQSEAYELSENGSSSLQNLSLHQVKGRDSVDISASHIGIQADINSLIANNLHMQSVEAKDLVVSVRKWDTASTRESNGMDQAIRIDRLAAIEPDITITTHRNDSMGIIRIPGSKNSHVSASDFMISPAGMQIGNLKINARAATFTKPTGEIVGIEKGKINMDLSDIRFSKKSGSLVWSGSANLISLHHPEGLGMGGMKNKFLFENASVGNLRLSSQDLPDFGKLMQANVSAWLHIPEGRYVDSNTTIQWHNARYDNSNRILRLDSFIYHPTLSLDSVMARAPYKLDYITLGTGAIEISGLDITQYEKDSSFIADQIKITDPVFTVYKDQKPPASPIVKEKPLLVNLIKRIALPVLVQAIEIENGMITYSERNAGSRKEGDLIFSNVYARIENIRNRKIDAGDSLSIKIKADLMDAAAVNLSLRQSYTDTLAGFVMHTTVGGTDLAMINPFLVPVTNVKISKGVLDSISFTVMGRDDIALGEMNLHYHDLKLKFVKDGDPGHSTFLQKVLGFAVNTFIVKSKNSSRKGLIYVKRESSQSFINYIVKMTLSGISTSAGLKKNRKLMKQYQKDLEKSGMREINEVPFRE